MENQRVSQNTEPGGPLQPLLIVHNFGITELSRQLKQTCDDPLQPHVHKRPTSTYSLCTVQCGLVKGSQADPTKRSHSTNISNSISPHFTSRNLLAVKCDSSHAFLAESVKPTALVHARPNRRPQIRTGSPSPVARQSARHPQPPAFSLPTSLGHLGQVDLG